MLWLPIHASSPLSCYGLPLRLDLPSAVWLVRTGTVFVYALDSYAFLGFFIVRDRSLHSFRVVQHPPHDSNQFVSVC